MSIGENTILGALKTGFKDAKTRFVLLCALGIIGILWIKVGQQEKDQKFDNNENKTFILSQLEKCQNELYQTKQQMRADNIYWNAKFDTMNYKYYNLSLKVKELTK